MSPTSGMYTPQKATLGCGHHVPLGDAKPMRRKDGRVAALPCPECRGRKRRVVSLSWELQP